MRTSGCWPRKTQRPERLQGGRATSPRRRRVHRRARFRPWSHRQGVADAGLFGNALVNAEAGGGGGRSVPVDLALFGVAADSWLAPPATKGTGLGPDPDGIVVSSTVADLGIGLGDVVTVDRIGTRLTVVGITADQNTFGHVDVAYVPLRTWQEIHAGVAPGERARPEAYTEATAVAVLARDGSTVDLAAGDAAAGTTSYTLEESYGASPGYTAETTTLDLIKGFRYVISALLIGAFFTVWTINRRHELAVIRAMGATAGHLVRDTIGQAAVVLVAATAVGAAVGVGAGALLAGDATPFALEAGPVTGASFLLVVLGLLGAAAAAIRVARIDPLTALGGAR
jgi:putative ABC transport system permease protein